MNYNKARAVTFGLFGAWLSGRERELERLVSEARKRYIRVEKIASKNIRNPFIRAVLKTVNRALRFAARRVENKIRHLREEIRKIENARARLESGDPSLAIDLLAEAGAITFPPMMAASDFPLGYFPANCFFMELIDGLRGERKGEIDVL